MTWRMPSDSLVAFGHARIHAKRCVQHPGFFP
jgi:hypothetical protein